MTEEAEAGDGEGHAGEWGAGETSTTKCLPAAVKGTWILRQEMFIGNQGLQGDILRISN